MTHLMNNYGRLPLAITAAAGSYVTDEEARHYLDFTSGIAVCNLGHRPTAVEEAVQAQLQQVWHTSNLFENRLQEKVAASLVAGIGAPGKVFFCNSGTEANEAAIKLARKHTGKETIVSFEHSFHGRTYGAMAATGQAKIHNGFGRLLAGFDYLPFNDSAALIEKLTTDDAIAAVMLELVQGEGGVYPAESTFIDRLVQLCTAKNILIIVDEVQTGFGRTGELFAAQQYRFVPDIMTLAKGLANGIPAGAVFAKLAVASAFIPGTHGSTFGGNYLAMAAAAAVLTKLTTTGFMAEVRQKSAYFMAQLIEIANDSPLIIAVRGRGFLIGLECNQVVAPLIEACRAAGLLLLSAGETVIRLLPPITASYRELDEALALLTVVFEQSPPLTN